MLTLTLRDEEHGLVKEVVLKSLIFTGVTAEDNGARAIIGQFKPQLVATPLAEMVHTVAEDENYPPTIRAAILEAVKDALGDILTDLETNIEDNGDRGLARGLLRVLMEGAHED